MLIDSAIESRNAKRKAINSDRNQKRNEKRKRRASDANVGHYYENQQQLKLIIGDDNNVSSIAGTRDIPWEHRGLLGQTRKMTTAGVEEEDQPREETRNSNSNDNDNSK